MSQFVLLLHEPASLSPGVSPEEMQAIIQRYKAWSTALAERGHLLGGDKLQDGTGRVLRNAKSHVSVTDGPYAETKEVIGGFFRIEAESYEQAVALARDCPHLAFGPVEIRQVDVV